MATESTEDTDTLVEYSVFFRGFRGQFFYLQGRFPLSKRHSSIDGFYLRSERREIAGHCENINLL
jgi:hypothetical protein